MAETGSGKTSRERSRSPLFMTVLKEASARHPRTFKLPEPGRRQDGDVAGGVAGGVARDVAGGVARGVARGVAGEPAIQLSEDKRVMLKQISDGIDETRLRLTDILQRQGQAIDESNRVLVEAIAHRKTAQSLAEMLGQISDDEAFSREAIALQNTEAEINKMKLQPAMAELTERDLLASSPEFQKALETIEFHHEACAGVVLTPEQLNFLKAAIIHPTVSRFLSTEEGDAIVAPNPDVVTIYTNRILELIRSPGLLSMITKTMSFNGDGAEQAVRAADDGNVDEDLLADAGAYQTSVGELNKLCDIACVAIRENDEILLQIIESIASLNNFNTVKGILKVGAGILSVQQLAPGVITPLTVLFEMGIEATGLVVSFALTNPVFYIVLGSHIIVNIEQYYSLLVVNALKVKQLAMDWIPESALANPPVAAALGGAPDPAVAQSKLVFGLVSKSAHNNFFKMDTAIGQIEGCIFRLVEVCTAGVSGAVGLFKEAAPYQVAQTALGRIPNCIQVIVDKIFQIRNTRCAIGGGAAVTATYKMRSAFLRSLQTGLDHGQFPSFNRAVRLIIHLSSVRDCALTIGLVSLHKAFDLVVKGSSTFARDALTDSQLANAGSPSIERAARMDSEPELAFFADNGFGGVLDGREVQSDGPQVKAEFLPQHNPRDFANWLLLAKLLAPQDATARAKPHKKWTNPIMKMIQAISALPKTEEQVRTIQEMVNDRECPENIKTAYRNFIEYIKQQKALAQQASVHASEEVVVNLDDPAQLESAIVAAAAAGDRCIVPVCNRVEETSVAPPGLPQHPFNPLSIEKGVEVHLPEGQMREGGKSRTHRKRASTTKRSRRKAYNKKSNKRKSRKQLSRKKISRRRQSRRK